MLHDQSPMRVMADRQVRLAGKTALVTGAGSSGAGIGNGRASAIVMARHGALVGLLDRSRDAAEETYRTISSEGGRAVVAECDVTSPADCARAVDSLADDLGGIDVLMNNVGILGARGTAVEVDLSEWNQSMTVNVTSMMLMAKHCIPYMVERGSGSIINVSSIAGLEGGHPDLLYPTSKGAVIQLTRAMAAHHGAQGVRVNCIAPGLVYTPMVSDGMTRETRDARRMQSLLGTEGTAWDVANAALFLASEESRWITGVVLPVDAGTVAARSQLTASYASNSRA